MGDIVTAITRAGLRIEFLHEFPYTTYKALPILEQGSDRYWWPAPSEPPFPLMFSIRATKS
jgi:hypothetical protein